MDKRFIAGNFFFQVEQKVIAFNIIYQTNFSNIFKYFDLINVIIRE